MEKEERKGIERGRRKIKNGGEKEGGNEKGDR